MGASGAYYVASATNKIYADKGSIVGSIGVIAEWVNYGELLKWAKLHAITMKAGEFKDTGSPTREMTPAEEKYFQGMIDNMHTQFIQAVADGRHEKADDIRALADGKVWTGEQALPLKLMDQLADFEGAVKDTARSVNISGEPSLVWPPKERRPGLVGSAVWRRVGLPALARKAAGAAGRVLLSVEVAGSRSQLSGLRSQLSGLRSQVSGLRSQTNWTRPVLER